MLAILILLHHQRMNRICLPVSSIRSNSNNQRSLMFYPVLFLSSQSLEATRNLLRTSNASTGPSSSIIEYQTQTGAQSLTQRPGARMRSLYLQPPPHCSVFVGIFKFYSSTAESFSGSGVLTHWLLPFFLQIFRHSNY